MIRSPGVAASIAALNAYLAARRKHGRSLAADRDGHGVDRLLAVGRRDDQLTALRGVEPPYCVCCCTAQVWTTCCCTVTVRRQAP